MLFSTIYLINFPISLGFPNLPWGKVFSNNFKFFTSFFNLSVLIAPGAILIQFIFFFYTYFGERFKGT